MTTCLSLPARWWRWPVCGEGGKGLHYATMAWRLAEDAPFHEGTAYWPGDTAAKQVLRGLSFREASRCWPEGRWKRTPPRFRSQWMPIGDVWNLFEQVSGSGIQSRPV